MSEEVPIGPGSDNYGKGNLDPVEYVWVPDSDWTFLKPYERKKCRHRGCKNTPAASLMRLNKHGNPHPWQYCADHLYGRRAVNGVVLCQVHPDSPAAKRYFRKLVNAP